MTVAKSNPDESNDEMSARGVLPLGKPLATGGIIKNPSLVSHPGVDTEECVIPLDHMIKLGMVDASRPTSLTQAQRDALADPNNQYLPSHLQQLRDEFVTRQNKVNALTLAVYLSQLNIDMLAMQNAVEDALTTHGEQSIVSRTLVDSFLVIQKRRDDVESCLAGLQVPLPACLVDVDLALQLPQTLRTNED